MTDKATIPTIRLDLTVPEHRQIWDDYTRVSTTGRAEWVRLTMLRGLESRRSVTAASSSVADAHVPESVVEQPRQRTSKVLVGIFGSGVQQPNTN